MKKIFSVILSFLLIFTLASCTKSYKVTFDADNNTDNKIVSVKENSLVKKPKEDPIKEGFKFQYWSLDGEEFLFEETYIEKNITLIAIWEEVSNYDYIKDVDYTPLIENAISLELTALLDEFSYEDEETVVIIEEISVKATFIGTFEDYESSKFNFELVVETGQIKTGTGSFLIPILQKVKFKQNFYLSEGNIYSSFEGTFVDASKEERPLKEFYPLFEVMILPQIPEDVQEQLLEILPLFKDRKEYVEDAFTEEIYNDLVDVITNSDEFLESYLPRELVEESPHFIEVSENGITVREGEDELIESININLNLSDNKFESLEGEVQFKEPNDLYLEFSLSFYEGEISLPDFDDYELVEELKIEQILNKVENPLLD